MNKAEANEQEDWKKWLYLIFNKKVLIIMKVWHEFGIPLKPKFG